MNATKDSEKEAIDHFRTNEPSDREQTWEAKLREAHNALAAGNNSKGRKLLKIILAEAPNKEMREEAERTLKSLSQDPWFYLIWGISTAVLVSIFVYYLLIK